MPKQRGLCSSFDAIPACDRRTDRDGHIDTGLWPTPTLAWRRAVKKTAVGMKYVLHCVSGVVLSPIHIALSPRNSTGPII